MNIGTNIYTLRKEKKITQAQLAEKLGVSEQSVSKWENDQCAPDVSLFPIIAEYFGVSIDRLFGYHMNSYKNEVKAILRAADDSMDTYKEIEIIGDGLRKYPNSPDLKIALAFSLSMINRISEDEDEKREAVNKAIKLCTEVVDTCGDTKQVDDALDMLTRIYNETGNYSKAEEAILKTSADSYHSRITGMIKMFGVKNAFKDQEQYAEDSLWKLYWTMSHVFEIMTNSYKSNGEYEKAIAFFNAHEKLLGIFDGGCPNFYATYKVIAAESKAQVYMKMGDKENCLASLKRFFELADQVKAVAESKDFNIAVRNPSYFSGISEEILEEYMPGIFPEKALGKYEAFFGEYEPYVQFKDSVIK